MNKPLVSFSFPLALCALLLGCSTTPAPRPCSRVLPGFATALHSRTLPNMPSGRVLFVASCSRPCRVEVYDAANPSAGSLCGHSSIQTAEPGGRHRAECAVELSSAGLSLGVDVGAGGTELTYSLAVSGAHTASFEDYVVPAGFGRKAG